MTIIEATKPLRHPLVRLAIALAFVVPLLVAQPVLSLIHI